MATNITQFFSPSDCTVVTNTSVSESGKYRKTIVLNAPNGYKFDNTVNVSARTLYDNNWQIYTATLSNGDKTASFSFLSDEENGTVRVGYNSSGVTITTYNLLQDVSTAITITQNTTNCTTNAPTTIAETDTALNVTATAASGYRFDTAPIIQFLDGNGDLVIDEDGNPAQYNFTIANDKLTASISVNFPTLVDLTNVASITITATAAAIPQNLTVTENLTFCSLSGVPQYVYPDTELNLTATANNGYKFETTPQLTFIDTNGNPNVVNFTVAANQLTATLIVDLGNYSLDNTSEIIINATATASTPYIDKYGTINVYKVTPENLSDFAEQRFAVENISQQSGDTPDYVKIDLGNYVCSVKRLYCSIGETIANVLKCGNYNTNIAVVTPLNDNLTIDCGTVDIPTPNENITDYNSEIQIFLPFVGVQNIPVDYIGKTVGLQYVINLVTANAVAKLSCNNIVFDCIECNLGNDIMYKTSETQGEIKGLGNLTFNMQVLKGLQPFVILKYYQSENKKIYNADCLRGVISGYIGYLEITEITNFNNSTITENEKRLLFDELQTGVIILQS